MDFKLICDIARVIAPDMYSGRLLKYRNDIAARLQAINLAEHNLEKYKYTPLAGIFNGKYAFDISHFASPFNGLESFNAPETFNGHLLDYDYMHNCDDYYIGSIGTASIDKRFGRIVRKYLGTVADADDFPAALSLAASVTGMFIYIEPNTVLAEPLVITNSICVTKPSLSINHNLIVIGENSRADVFVRNILNSDSHILSNVLTETVIGKNASLDIVHLTRGTTPEKGKLLFTDSYLQEENSVLKHTNVTLGGDTVRRNTEVKLASNAETRLSGLTVATGKNHIDNHTFIDHAMPSATSSELYKSIVCNSAVSVFNGRIRVGEDAQKTAAYQLSKNILLHDDAKCYSKPQLEIHADDVKCSHGAAVGQMDREALFYLQSRGISRAAAQRLILSGFAEEIIQQVGNPELRETLNSEVEKWMAEKMKI